MNITKKFGWRPDKPDHRDYKFKIERLLPIQPVYLSDKYNLALPYDQGDIGSCTGNGLSFACHFALLNKNVSGKPIAPFRPSRLFIYYYERVIENTVSIDAGAEIRDGIKVLAAQGIPSEDAWIYDTTQFATKPSDYAISCGKKLTSLRYESLDNTNKQLLVNALLQGLPIVFGVTVYTSFMSDYVAATGIVPYPGKDETVEGGHCMVIVGYSQQYDAFIVRNSWGVHWGQDGYCRIPAAYLCNPDLATDFWVVYTLQNNS